MVKLYLENGKIRIYKSNKNIRRILSRVSLTQFKKGYVRVSYGKKEDAFGEMVMFDNEGYYKNKVDLKGAIIDFWNEEL